MREQRSPGDKATSLLGAHLAAVRKDRGYSLRQVEKLTKQAVSNAYLSQVESGKIQQPSPNILHALSAAYKISYEQLMEMAGYIGSGKKRASGAATKPSTFTELNLTPEEENELLEYLQFRRSLKSGKPT
jgi:HTH-type transcriptional regulator, competence development regulator